MLEWKKHDVVAMASGNVAILRPKLERHDLVVYAVDHDLLHPDGQEPGGRTVAVPLWHLCGQPTEQLAEHLFAARRLDLR